MEKQPLEIAEYVALAGSAAGTLVAWASGQVLYAAAPLTFALSLNLANRRRFEQQSQQYATETIAQATQASRSVQSLQQQIQALPAINTQLKDLNQQFNSRPELQAIEQLEGAIAQLTGQLNDVASHLGSLSRQEVDLTGVEQVIAHINGELDALTLRLDQLPTPQAVDLTEVEQAIANINGQLNALTLRLEEQPTPQAVDLTGIEQVILDLQGQLNAVTERLDNAPTSQGVDLTGIEQAIADLQGQLNAVTERLDDAPTPQAVELNGVEQAIADLQGQLNSVSQRLDNAPTPQTIDLAGIEQAIADLNGRLDSLNQQFNNRAETQALEQPQSAIAQLTEQLNALTQRLEHAPTPPATDLNGVEWAILDINNQLDSLNQQFNTRPETQALEQAQNAIAQLTEQLAALTQRLDNTSTPQAVEFTDVEQAIEQSQGAIAQIYEELAALTQRLDNAPTAQAIDFTSIEQAIADINGRLDSLNHQFNNRPETQALQQSQSAVAQLTERIVDLTLRLNNAPTPQAVDFTGVERAIADLNSRLDSLNQQFNNRPETEALEQSQSAIELLSEQLAALGQRLEDAPTAQGVDLTGVEQAIANINSRLDSLNQQFNNRPETQALEQSESAIVMLSEQLAALGQRLEDAPTPQTVDLTGVEQAIADVNSRLDSLNQQFNNRPETQALEQAQSAIELLSEQLAALGQSLEHVPTPQAVDLSGIEQAITDINGRLDSLNQQFNNRPETQALEQSQSAIVMVSQQLAALGQRLDDAPTAQTVDLTGVEQAIADINSRLDSLNRQFNNRPETEALEQAQSAIEMLSEQLVLLIESREQAPTAQAVDLTGVEQAIANLNSRLDSLNQQFDNRPETQEIEQLQSALIQLAEQLSVSSLHQENLPTPQEVKPRTEQVVVPDIQEPQNLIASPTAELLTPVAQAVEAIEEEEVDLTGIQGQINALNKRFLGRPETQAIKQIEGAIAQFAQQLNAMASRVGNLPTAPGVDLGGVRQAIADSQGQLNTLNEHFRSRPETEAIEQLDGAIAQLAELGVSEDEEALEEFNFQLDAMTLCLGSLPPSLVLDLSGVAQAIANVDSQLDVLATGSQGNGSASSSSDLWGDAHKQVIEPLQGAIAQLKEELNAAISYLENLGDPQGGDLWGDEDEIANLQW